MAGEYIAYLQENLQQQLELYQELLKIANIKEQVLIANDVKALDALVAREESAVMLGARLERERIALQQPLAVEMGLPPEELTLMRLVQDYPQLGSFQVDLEQVIKDIQTKQQINSNLLQQAMQIVDFTMQLLMPIEDAGYSRNNGSPEKRKAPVRMQRIIDKSV